MNLFFHKPPHGPQGEEQQLLTGYLKNLQRDRGTFVHYYEEVWGSWRSRLSDLTCDGNWHLIYIPNPWLPELALDGTLMNLSEICPNEVERWKSLYPESIFRLGKTSEGQFGIPVYGAVWSFMYNERLFIDAGIQSVPKTWKDLWNGAEALKRRFPELIPYGINDDSDGHFIDHGYIYLFAGGKWERQDQKGEFRFDNDASVYGLSFLRKMVERGLANLPINTPSNRIRDQFFSGKIAMTVGPSDWVLWQRKNVPDFPLRIAMMPCPENGTPLSFSSYGFYCVIPGEKKEGLNSTLELLDRFVHPKFLEEHIKTIGMLPLQNNSTLHKKDKDLSVFSQQVKWSGEFPNEALPYFSCLTENIVSCLRLEKTPLEALQSVNKHMVEEES